MLNDLGAKPSDKGVVSDTPFSHDVNCPIVDTPNTAVEPAPIQQPLNVPSSAAQNISANSMKNPVVKYCPYPELTNGKYKFKSSLFKEATSANNSDDSESYIYKRTLDEETMQGYVELADLNMEQVKIITNNPTMYTPQDVCVGAENIVPGKTSIRSQSKLRLEKVVRGWVIADGQKFVLNVSGWALAGKIIP